MVGTGTGHLALNSTVCVSPQLSRVVAVSFNVLASVHRNVRHLASLFLPLQMTPQRLANPA